MLDVVSNISEVVLNITNGLNQLGDEDKVVRSVAQSLVAVVHDRIHDKGNDSNDIAIGTYSDSYLNLRLSKRYNRTKDAKVILSLTRQMENDFSVVKTDNGYGLGFKNDFNFKKAQWSEKTYDKSIYKLTDNENETVITIAEFEVNKILNG